MEPTIHRSLQSDYEIFGNITGYSAKEYRLPDRLSTLFKCSVSLISMVNHILGL